MPAAATQPRLDRRAMPDNARGQIMALVARNAVEDVTAPGEGGGDQGVGLCGVSVSLGVDQRVC